MPNSKQHPDAGISMLIIGGIASMFFAWMIYASPLPLAIRFVLTPFFLLAIIAAALSTLRAKWAKLVVLAFVSWIIAAIVIMHAYASIYWGSPQFSIISSLVIGYISRGTLAYYHFWTRQDNSNILHVIDWLVCIATGLVCTLTIAQLLFVDVRNIILFATILIFCYMLAILRPTTRATIGGVSLGTLVGIIITYFSYAQDASNFMQLVFFVWVIFTTGILIGALYGFKVLENKTKRKIKHA